MTRERRHGNDSCFGDWLRSQPDIRSTMPDCVTANDVDYIMHKYEINRDQVGDRNVHLIMHMEAKVLGGMPNENQAQTLNFWHQLTKNKRKKLVDSKRRQNVSVWSFGVFVCSCPGFYPGDNSDTVDWCAFDEKGNLEKRSISIEQLKSVIRFELHPETLEKIDLRRHHKTSHLIATERTPLGFTVDQLIVSRS